LLVSRIRAGLRSAEWLGGGKAQGQSWRTAERLLDGLEELSDQERDVVRTRWLVATRRYDELWQKQRLGYFFLRGLTLVGAAIVPVLVSLSAPRLATAIVGLSVAILTGLDSLFRLAERWRQARFAASVMGSEGWRFLELSGDTYRGLSRQDACKVFLSRLEDVHERISMMRLDIFTDGGREFKTPVVR
jgi:hypothetical protein